MERLAKKMAESIGKSLNKSSDEVAVIAYGLIGILQFLTIFIVSFVIGLVCGFFAEVIVVFLSVGFLRRLTGGAHSSGMYSCLIYSVFFVCSISALARYVLPMLNPWVQYGFAIVVFAFGYTMIALRAPVTPPNKPCRTEAKRKRLRRGSFIVLSLFAAIVIALFLVGQKSAGLHSVGLALVLSTLWQITMMTKAGHTFISAFDSLFYRNK
jgi:accessory gene regulator B